MAAGTAGEPPAQGWADEPAASWVDDDATYASPTIGANPELPGAPLAERTDVAVVVHDGVPHELDPVQVLTFGRSALCTICLDGTDRGISRLAGSVRHESGTWWLSNCSTKRVLTVVDDLGIRSLLVPGRRIALGGRLTVVVEGSVRRHALDVRANVSVVSITGETPQFEGDGPPTAAAGEVLIKALDRLALVSLFSGYLEPFPRYHPHPRSYADAAAMLGWPRTTLVKRIEHLRTRLTNAGFPNLVGDEALEHLAEWALTSGVLTREDLQLIGR